MSSAESTRFYVYIHRRKDNNAIFYVGKGKGSRASNKSSRNRLWKAIYEKSNGRVVEIVETFDTEQEALAHEVFLIFSLRMFGVTLANLVDGGGGTCGWKHDEETRAKMSRTRTGTPLSESHYKSVADAQRRPDVRAKRSASLRAFYAVKENREAHSQRQAKLGQSSEFRAKVGDSTSKARRARGLVTPVINVTTGQSFECLADAIKWLRSIGREKAKHSTLLQVVGKPHRTSYGYKWEFPTKSHG